MALTPEGWHPDPRGRHELRYWDGTAWTDHVADGGTVSTDPVSRVLAAERPAEPEAPPERPSESLWARPEEPEPAAVEAPAPPEPEPEPDEPDVEAPQPGPQAATTSPDPTRAWLLLGAGAALVIGLILPWYRVRLLTGFGSVTADVSGFDALGLVDLLLVLIAIAAVAAGVATLAGEIPAALLRGVAIGALGGLVLIVFRMLVDPLPGEAAGIGVGRGPGILVDAVAAFAVVLAARPRTG